MITAAEAYTATINNRELNSIRDLIADAIRSGSFECHYMRRTLSKETRNALRRLGYQISGAAPYIISWEK